MNKNLKKVLLFICLTFFFNWSMAILFFALGGGWNTPASLIMAVVYMFIPMVVAIIVQKFIYKERIKEPLGISFKLNRWFLIAWLLPPVIAFASLGVSLFLPNVQFSPEMEGLFEMLKSAVAPERLQQMKRQVANFSSVYLVLISLLQGLVAGISINAVVSFGEELGWRGFLQRELGFLGFWKSSVTIGLIWGIWHAPIILQGHNYPQHPLAGVFMMTVFAVLLAPVFSYVRLKANSVIAAAIIHGSLNATAGLPLMLIEGYNDLIVGVTGLAGFIVLIVINIGLLLFDCMLAKEPVMFKKRGFQIERSEL